MEENCQYGIWKNRYPFHALLVITFFSLREILQNLPLVMSQNREMQGFQWYGVKWIKSFFRE